MVYSVMILIISLLVTWGALQINLPKESNKAARGGGWRLKPITFPVHSLKRGLVLLVWASAHYSLMSWWFCHWVEELISLEGLPPASICCKEVEESVNARSDPLLPRNKDGETRRPFRLKQILDVRCPSTSSSCCCCMRCKVQSDASCCSCNFLKKWRCSCWKMSCNSCCKIPSISCGKCSFLECSCFKCVKCCCPCRRKWWVVTIFRSSWFYGDILWCKFFQE